MLHVADDTHGQATKAKEVTQTKDTANGKKEQKFIDTILLVLEYAPGGELFDILYYTSALNEKIARTYFKQLMDGMEACHDAGICHRDIKPQNLLLDANFQLKIADFGLAKVFEKDEDALMRTFYVGTRGYQSPEILKKKEYTTKSNCKTQSREI
jgi:serine/threonine protein kinase